MFFFTGNSFCSSCFLLKPHKPSSLSRNETSVPTHFFLIMTSCRNSSLTPVNCEGPLQAIAFIMPHKPDYSEFCAVSNTNHTSVYFTSDKTSVLQRRENVEKSRGQSFMWTQSRITVGCYNPSHLNVIILHLFLNRVNLCVL